MLTHESLELVKVIGGGQFGDVYLGTFKQAPGRKLDVAIKTLKNSETVEKVRNLNESNC